MGKVTFEAEFKIGQTVYLKTDPEQDPRIVVGFLVRQKDVLYELAFGDFSAEHYGFEISEDVVIVAH